ncbi:hypothetical protein N7519_001667 [Penicillium mononematosum]|uniref:uncharacterized protein n=1 Tax=Penicillium mononematosum TaxID=268346 RepID=UPI00254916CF|nr:uncharacterized protein N7519_001667 [Penicillium mononematosum]KAJ6191646.1 hypothetical protein N7519_001667 [Penicillium mononematosum]
MHDTQKALAATWAACDDPELSDRLHPNHPRFDIRALNNSIGWEGEMERIVAEEQATTGRQRIISLQDMPPPGSPTNISSNDNDEP